jgi:hypothetical protein
MGMFAYHFHLDLFDQQPHLIRTFLSSDPAPTMSKLMFLEHVNVNTGHTWTEALENFYFYGLGFAKDPRAVEVFQRTKARGGDGSGLCWANIGLQQFHLPWASPEQRIRGTIGLYYPSLEILAPRLRRANVDFSVTQLPDETVFDLTCPIGNKFRVHEYVPEDDARTLLYGPGQLMLPPG